MWLKPKIGETYTAKENKFITNIYGVEYILESFNITKHQPPLSWKALTISSLWANWMKATYFRNSNPTDIKVGSCIWSSSPFP